MRKPVSSLCFQQTQLVPLHPGEVARVELAVDRTVNQPTGFAFVEFRAESDAVEAYKHMGKEVHSRVSEWCHGRYWLSSTCASYYAPQ